MTEIEITKKIIPECTLQEPRWWGAQAQLASGEVIIAGGNIFNDENEKKEIAIDSIEVINPVTCEKIQKGQLSQVMRGTQAVLTNTQIYFFGGRESTAIESCELNKECQVSGNMNQARSGSAQIVLIDGKILITGGYDMSQKKSGILSSAEVFDLQTGLSSPTSAMQFSRAGHTMTMLDDRQYLVIGGKDDAAKKTEIYNSGTREFSLGPELNFGRKDHQAVVDSLGRIWILGGTGPDGKSVKEIEYYDPITKVFVNVSQNNSALSLSVGREDLSATYLPELGVIVAIGGEIKGETTSDGIKDPLSDAIDVIDIVNLTITSAKLSEPRDEPTIAIVNPLASDSSVELILLQGRGQNLKPVAVEKITISKRQKN